MAWEYFLVKRIKGNYIYVQGNNNINKIWFHKQLDKTPVRIRAKLEERANMHIASTIEEMDEAGKFIKKYNENILDKFEAN